MLKKTIVLILLTFSIIVRGQTPINTLAGNHANSFFNGGAGLLSNFNSAFPNYIFASHTGKLIIPDFASVRQLTLATNYVTKIAGSGIWGYNGDGITANSAELTLPCAAVSDASGNVYFSESIRIRKISTSGIITTFAGNGVYGFGGDGGSATAAQISTPDGLAIDDTGNIYFADLGNNRVRKVTVSGLIYTIAGNGSATSGGDGGPATLASLVPRGLKIDGAGNLYVADASNNTVRKIAVSGIINTIAGAGTSGFSGDGGPAIHAQFNFPCGIEMDHNRNIYISDMYNNRVRKIDTSGNITTIAGNGSSGSYGDGGPATNAALSSPSGIAIDSLGSIYVFTGDESIRKINSSGIISTIAGNNGYGGDGGAATAALLQYPVSVSADNSGNIYFADNGNNTIRKIGVGGIVNTIVGRDSSGYYGDNGAATAAILNSPNFVAVRDDNDIFISDAGNQRIRIVNHVTGNISSYVGTGLAGYSGDGGPSTAARISGPVGIVFDNGGNIYISDQGNNVIRRVDSLSGVISTFAGNGISGFSGDGGPATAASLSSPAHIAFDGANNLYIADQGNDRIRMVDAASGVISTIFGNGLSGYGGDGGMATSAELCQPFGLAIDPDNGVYVTTCGKIRHVPTGGGPVTSIAGDTAIGIVPDGTLLASAVFNRLSGICFDHANNLLMTDLTNHSIRKAKVLSEGISNLKSSNVDLDIFPAPNRGTFDISGKVLGSGIQRETFISIVDVLGREIYRSSIKIENGMFCSKIVLSETQASGVYFCRIVGEQTNMSKSFLLQR